MASASPCPDPNLDAEWEEWKREFKKTYSQVGNIIAIHGDLRENEFTCKELGIIKAAIETIHHQGIA